MWHGRRAHQIRRRRKNFSEFEIDDAEAAELVRVSDVARLCVEMANAILSFEFREKLVGLFLGDLARDFAAVSGDELELLRVFLQQSRHIGAAAFFQYFQHGHFCGVALVRIRASQTLVHVAVKIDPHFGANAILEWFERHAAETKPARGPTVTHLLTSAAPGLIKDGKLSASLGQRLARLDVEFAGGKDGNFADGQDVFWAPERRKPFV